MRASEKGSRISVKVNPPRPRKPRKGQEVSYLRCAEASGVDEAELMSRRHYCCRERMLVTTEWLFSYIARTYTGMGTALDNLLQAGKIGVLDGAEKFDNRKGCRFSTYVKYWIRKGMLALLAQNSGVTLLSAGAQVLLQGCLALLGDRDQTTHISSWR